MQSAAAFGLRPEKNYDDIFINYLIQLGGTQKYQYGGS